MICSDQNSYKDEKEGQVTNSNYYSYDALAPDATAKDVLLPLMLRERSEQSRMLDALHSEKRMLFTKHPIFSRSSLELASNQGNQPARLYIEHVSSSQSVTNDSEARKILCISPGRGYYDVDVGIATSSPMTRRTLPPPGGAEDWSNRLFSEVSTSGGRLDKTASGAGDGVCHQITTLPPVANGISHQAFS